MKKWVHYSLYNSHTQDFVLAQRDYRENFTRKIRTRAKNHDPLKTGGSSTICVLLLVLAFTVLLFYLDVQKYLNIPEYVFTRYEQISTAMKCVTLLLKIGSRQSQRLEEKSVSRASGILEVELLLVGMKVVYPQVLFRGGRQPFRGNNREWYPREASGRARGLRVLERMVIMERCILTMFITEGARRHNSLSALRAFLSWNFSRRGLQILARCIRVIEWQCPTVRFEILCF